MTAPGGNAGRSRAAGTEALSSIPAAGAVGPSAARAWDVKFRSDCSGENSLRQLHSLTRRYARSGRVEGTAANETERGTIAQDRCMARTGRRVQSGESGALSRALERARRRCSEDWTGLGLRAPPFEGRKNAEAVTTLSSEAKRLDRERPRGSKCSTKSSGSILGVRGGSMAGDPRGGGVEAGRAAPSCSVNLWSAMRMQPPGIRDELRSLPGKSARTIEARRSA